MEWPHPSRGCRSELDGCDPCDEGQPEEQGVCRDEIKEWRARARGSNPHDSAEQMELQKDESDGVESSGGLGVPKAMVAKQVEKAPYTNRGDDSHGDSQPNIDVIFTGLTTRCIWCPVRSRRKR